MNSDAKEALRKECELVELLAAVAKHFAEKKAVTTLEKEALGAWEPDLLRHRDINQILIGFATENNAQAFDNMAQQELAILNAFIANLNSNNTSVGQGFRQHFTDDREILQNML